MCRLLGLSLYEAWIEGLAAPEPAQIWLDLKGRIFKTTAGASLSPAANYVYFHGMGLSASQTMMTGEKRQKGSFSDNVSVVRKQVTAWNDMIDAVSHIREWVFVHRKDLASEMPQTEHFHWREWCGHHFSPINELGL